VARLCVAFDVDGTLWCGLPPGPVTAEWFRALCRTPDTGVVVVSGSPNRPRPVEGWAEINQDPDRQRNLEAAGRIVEADVRLYVSDNEGDDARAASAGFVFVRPENFRL